MVDSHGTGSSSSEVLRYVRAVKRRLELILLPVVLVPCAAIIGLSFISSTYESSSIVLYSERVPFAGDLEKMLVQKPDYRVRDRERLAQIETRLKSRVFLEEVSRRLNIGLRGRAESELVSTLPPGVSIDELKARVIVEALRKNMKVEEIGPDLFQISLLHPERDMAYLLADGITNSFVDYVTKGQLADIRAAGSFSEDQLPVYEEKLTRSENALKRHRSQMATRENKVDVRYGERARTLQREVDAEITELESRAETAKKNLRRTYPNEVDPTTLIRSNAIRSAYSEVVREEETGAPLLVEGSSAASVAERVGQAREALLARIEETVSTTLKGSPQALQSLVTEIVYDDYVINSLRARKRALSTLLSNYNQSVGLRQQDEVELRRLEQEVESNRGVLQSLRTQLTSARMSEAAQTTNLGVRIEVIEPAARPMRPAGPKRQKIMVLALILGPFLGISFAVLSEYMDDTVRSVRDVSKGLGVAVLGTIPRMPTGDFWQAGRRRRWPFVAMLVALVLAVSSHVAHGPLLNVLGRAGHGIEAGSPAVEQEEQSKE